MWERKCKGMWNGSGKESLAKGKKDEMVVAAETVT